jgi:hypothetical protein
MLTREDVERIVSNVIRERELMTKDEFIQGLSISVTNGDFTNPNSRTVTIKFNGVEITSDYFDVVQTREYEG